MGKVKLGEPMTTDQLRQFVLDYCDGHLFALSMMDNPRDAKMVFVPLACGILSNLTRAQVKQIGNIWEHLSKALPQGINGMPMFISCHLMLATDWERAKVAIKAELARRKDIKV